VKTLTIIPERGELDCLITRVVDGDTFDVALFVPLRVRLHGIQVAESNTDKGKLVIKKLTDRLTKQCATLTLKGREKFGRMLGSIRMEDNRDVAEWLIGLGLAVEWDGKGPRPVGMIEPIPGEELTGIQE
jgi:endonuclease YncB( thermonuclease family)